MAATQSAPLVAGELLHPGHGDLTHWAVRRAPVEVSLQAGRYFLLPGSEMGNNLLTLKPASANHHLDAAQGRRHPARIERVTRHLAPHHPALSVSAFAADPGKLPRGGQTDSPSQTAPPTPPTPTPVAAPVACLPVRTPPRLHRRPVAPGAATAIYRDLVDQHGFARLRAGTKRSGRGAASWAEPVELPSVRLQLLQQPLGRELPGTGRWRKPRLFVASAVLAASRHRVVWNPASRSAGPSCTSSPGAEFQVALPGTWCSATSRSS